MWPTKYGSRGHHGTEVKSRVGEGGDRRKLGGICSAGLRGEHYRNGVRCRQRCQVHRQECCGEDGLYGGQ